MCTTYGTKMTGIARYARMLYAFWISVSRPNCAIRKSAMQQTSAARIWVRLILPAVSVLLLHSARPAWIRLTMAATMLTAVDTAPRMISTEISGVMNLLPTPC